MISATGNAFIIFLLAKIAKYPDWLSFIWAIIIYGAELIMRDIHTSAPTANLEEEN